MDAVFALVDLTKIAAFVAAGVAALVGYRLIFKGGDIAGKVIHKA